LSESYPNSGSLFREEQKSKPTSPDYGGMANIDCPHCARRIELRLSAWLKVGRSGKKFMSLSFRPKTAAAQKGARDDYREPPF